MKNILILIFIVLLPMGSYAQKKELADARTNIKKGTNLEKVESTMRNLLKDSANIRNEKIWLTLFDAVKKQYEQNNEKLYLKQQSDTAKFFTHTKHMFDVLEALDSVDVVNTKGLPVYRKKHASFLNQHRKNLFNGGAYYLKKQNFGESASFFEKYIRCASHPLFSDYNYSEKDADGISEAAYWCSYCGYKLHNAQLIDRYARLGIRDTTREVYILQYIAESYLLKEDMKGYREVLERGLEKYPTHGYFFPHLSALYAQHEMYYDIIRICKTALTADADNKDALQAYSSALFATEQYDECIEVTEHLLELDENLAIGYLNVAKSYYHGMADLLEISVPNREQRTQLEDICSKALPYFEHYRQICPDDIESYALPLYNIYLTLNMGDGFEEMEKILYGE